VLSHPARYYIYYLFSRRALDAAAIVQNLADLGLPVPQSKEGVEGFAKELREERQKMAFPPAFNPLEPAGDTDNFLRKWKIRDMWAKDPFVLTATDLLWEPGPRRMLQTLLLGPLNYSDIAYRIRRRFGYSDDVVNTRVVRLYAHYYWDDTSLTPQQWRTLLYSWTKGGISDYLTALNAPRSQAGAALAISAADRGGGASLSPVIMYQCIRDQGFKMFMEHTLLDKPGLDRTQGAMFALKIVREAEEELDKRRGGSAELIEELAKIETVYDETRLRTVHDLPQVRQALPQTTQNDVVDVEGEDVTKEPK
jgi:hypothetical protein